MNLKTISSLLVGLILLYLFVSLGWSILNAQTCTYELPKNPTCEQIAKNDADNCKYVILRWKKVDYNKELQKCKLWELNKNK